LNRGELRKVRESRQLHGHLPIPGRVRCFRKCRGRNTRMSAQNRGQNDPGLRCLRTHDPDRNSTANSQDDLADHTVCRPAARFPIAGSQSCAQMSQALGNLHHADESVGRRGAPAIGRHLTDKQAPTRNEHRARR